jgi:hypothetical protein
MVAVQRRRGHRGTLAEPFLSVLNDHNAEPLTW